MNGIFLTIKDLMRLLGTDCYFTAAKEHKAIRDALNKKDKRLTIREYCRYEELDFKYVWGYLRENKNE